MPANPSSFVAHRVTKDDGVASGPRSRQPWVTFRQAVELAEANGWFLARQFETEANAAIHEATTGREIINDFAGSRLDYLVTGYGTGGTVVGVGRVLRHFACTTTPQ